MAISIHKNKRIILLPMMDYVFSQRRYFDEKKFKIKISDKGNEILKSCRTTFWVERQKVAQLKKLLLHDEIVVTGKSVNSSFFYHARKTEKIQVKKFWADHIVVGHYFLSWISNLLLLLGKQRRNAGYQRILEKFMKGV